MPILEESIQAAGADEVGQRRVAKTSLFAFGGSGQPRARPDKDEAGDPFRMSEGPMERETATQGVAEERDLRRSGGFGDQREVRLDGIIAKVTLVPARAMSGQVRGVKAGWGGQDRPNRLKICSFSGEAMQ